MTNQPSPEPKLTDREQAQIWMAALLGRLYDSSPRKVDLALSDIDPGSKEANIAESKQIELWFDMVDWLRSEGFIRIGQQQIATDEILDIVLTGRAYEVLGLPAPMSPEKTIGSKLSEFAKDVGKEAGRSGLREAGKDLADKAGQFVGGLLKSFTGS